MPHGFVYYTESKSGIIYRFLKLENLYTIQIRMSVYYTDIITVYYTKIKNVADC